VKDYTGKYNSTDVCLKGAKAAKTVAYWLGQMDTLDVETISFGSGNYLPIFVADLHQKKALRLMYVCIVRFSEKEPKLVKLYWSHQKKVLGTFTSKEDAKAALDRLKSVHYILLIHANKGTI
jgi:hypothetical protein